MKIIDLNAPFKDFDMNDKKQSFFLFLHTHMASFATGKDNLDITTKMIHQMFKDITWIKRLIIELKMNDLKSSTFKMLYDICETIEHDDNTCEMYVLQDIFIMLHMHIQRLICIFIDRAINIPYLMKIYSEDVIWISLSLFHAVLLMDKDVKMSLSQLYMLYQYKKVYITDKDIHKEGNLDKYLSDFSHKLETHHTQKVCHDALHACMKGVLYYDLEAICYQPLFHMPYELQCIRDAMYKHKHHTHVLLLPQLDYKHTFIMVDFLNHLDAQVEVMLCIRGSHVIQDFFDTSSMFYAMLKNKDHIRHACLIVDTDEFSFHINQIKRSHSIDTVIIDVDALIKDIWDDHLNPNISKHTFKTQYMHVFKDIHAHLRIQGIKHLLYSSQLHNKDVYKLFKSAGFQLFLTHP